MTKIYVELKPEEGEGLLSYFMRLYNVNSSGKKHFPISFTDTRCDSENVDTIQCGADRYRSLDELFIIVNTMWGEVTPQEFIKMIKEFMDMTRRHIIIFCNSVDKFVLSNRLAGLDAWLYRRETHYKNQSHIIPGYFYDYGGYIRSGFTKKKYKGLFTFENILLFMGYPDFYAENMIRRSERLAERRERREEIKLKQMKKEFEKRREARLADMESIVIVKNVNAVAV